MLILRTERLALRQFHPDDAKFLLGLLNEPGWISGIRDSGVRTLEAARDWMRERLIEPYARHGHGFWRIERLSDGEPLGLCGLFKRDGLPLPDLGYGLAERHAGHGYAREAARACLDYAQRVLGRDELLAITNPVNPRSSALLAELGFVDEGVAAGEQGPTRTWRWRAAGARQLDDAAQIDALVARFFAAFGNRDGRIPTLAALPALFLPEAQIQAPGRAPCGLAEFIAPRAALLLEGRLREFAEWELASQTRVEGRHAVRELSYAKQGRLDDEPYGGTGRKRLEFARDGEGRWRIAALSWHDD